MVKTYAKGRTIEYKARDWLRKEGYYVIRSAGSKTLIDLVAIGKTHTLLIQVKSRHMNTSEVAKLIDLQVPVDCYKELWHWKKKTQSFSRQKV